MSAEQNLLEYDDEYFNGLATDWFFLNLFFRTSEYATAQRVIDVLIDISLLLKPCLKACGHTYLEPRNIYVDQDVYFDIWLDADDDIQATELYLDEPGDLEYDVSDL